MTRLRRGGLEPGVGLLALLIALIVLPPALPAATRVIAWGTNNFGQLDVPPGLTNVISIATAPYAAIALTAEGRLVPWGDNRNGQLNINRSRLGFGARCPGSLWVDQRGVHCRGRQPIGRRESGWHRGFLG
jgi:hypothetical protein